MDVVAFKPGNVSLASPGHGMFAEAFLQSTEASAPEMARPGIRIGQRILNAATATRDAVGCNTNLGILLLCAPVMQACHDYPASPLQAGTHKVLENTTVSDGDAVYEAIRLASPGGLGRLAEHDVAASARLSLTDAMRVAAERDLIARQYANGFVELFGDIVPFLDEAMQKETDMARACTMLYLYLLCRYPDTHIRRKHGDNAARHVMRLAADVRRGWETEPDRIAAQGHLVAFDSELKKAGLNPGTTADFCVAGLFCCRLQQQTELKPRGYPECPAHPDAKFG